MVTATLGVAQSLGGNYYIGNAGTAPGGDDPQFSSLKSAFDLLMTEGINADVTFLISSDLDESENVFLGFDATPHTVTIRPAPETTPTVTFSSGTSNSTINGSLVIGASAGNDENLTLTKNIVFDGSNSPGGTTRDMTFTVSASANSSNYFRIAGAVHDSQIKNMVFNTLNNSFDTWFISPLEPGDELFAPNNLVFENNHISNNPTRSSGRAVNIWGQFSPSGGGQVIIRNNDIQARRHGVWLRETASNTIIEGNTISVTETGTLAAYQINVTGVVSASDEIVIRNNNLINSSSGGTLTAINLESPAVYTISGNTLQNLSSAGLFTGVNVNTNGSFSITENKFSQINGDAGIEMISFTGIMTEDYTANVHNNVITGFESANGSGENLYGVIVRSPVFPAVATVNMYHNTIRMNSLDVTGTGWDYRGLSLFSNLRITVNLKNNIIINDDTNNSAVTSYAYYQAGSATANLTSDNNLWFGSNLDAETNTYLSRHGAPETTTDDFATHQANTNQDANSVSKAVEFISANDLRLTGASDGDTDLTGATGLDISKDAFGNLRNKYAPYIGAFEGTPLSPSVRILGDAGWRMMASPASNYTILDIMDQTGIQGVEGADLGSNFLANIYTGYNGTEWTQPENVNAPLESGKGFILYFYNNDTAGSRPLPVTMFAPGQTPATDVTISGIHANGNRYNLLGNPFNAPISIDQITSNGTVSANGQVWVDATGESANGETVAGSWVPTTAAEFDGKVAAWQGFMLQNDEANPATSVTIPTSAIVSESETGFQKQHLAHRLLTLQLTGNSDNGETAPVDVATTLYFHPEATLSRDRFDLDKLAPIGSNSVLLYYIGEGNQPKAQYSLPYDIDSAIDIDLDVYTYGLTGEFNIAWTELVNLDTDDVSIYLFDNVTGREVDINQELSYTFEIEQSAAKQKSFSDIADTNEARFTLKVRPVSTTSYSQSQLPQQLALFQNYPNPFNPVTTIRYEVPSSGEAELAVYDMLGRRISTLVNETSEPGTYSVRFDAQRLSSGVYLYQLRTDGQTLVRQMTLIK
ncbi:MAG: T9SS type A sorting domain-containing protein [Balneolales bacterium]|nr:T9SS type A sorting domain-containing protein [Balneolales bacterium]